MPRTLHAFLASIWCLYGISALTHSTTFWASLFGFEMPHLSMLILDVIYYSVSAIMCPYYIHKGWGHLCVCLKRDEAK